MTHAQCTAQAHVSHESLHTCSCFSKEVAPAQLIASFCCSALSRFVPSASLELVHDGELSRDFLKGVGIRRRPTIEEHRPTVEIHCAADLFISGASSYGYVCFGCLWGFCVLLHQWFLSFPVDWQDAVWQCLSFAFTYDVWYGGTHGLWLLPQRIPLASSSLSVLVIVMYGIPFLLGVLGTRAPRAGLTLLLRLVLTTFHADRTRQEAEATQKVILCSMTLLYRYCAGENSLKISWGGPPRVRRGHREEISPLCGVPVLPGRVQKD